MKTLHIAIQDQSLMLHTEDEFDFDEMLEVSVSLLRGVMNNAGKTPDLQKEVYSRVNYKMSSLLAEFIPDEECQKLFASTDKK